MAETQTALEKMSSEDLKQLLAEQTSALVTEANSEVVATEELPSQTVIPPTEEEPAPQETPSETKSEPEAKTVKLKVEGKEVEIPEDKVLEYAQKGFHYEKKMADVKNQRAELERLKSEHPAPSPSPFTPDQIKAELAKRFETVETAIPTIIEMINAGIENRENMSKQERIADLQFDIDKTADVPHWPAIKTSYERMRLLGESRESAFLKAENDYFRTLYVNAHKAGVKEGTDKAKLKEAADLPGGGKRETTVAREQTGPTDAQLRSMSSAELAKFLPRREVED